MTPRERWAGSVGLGPCEDLQVVRSVGERAPHLLAVDAPALAVRRRTAAQVGDVRAGLGLGQGECAQEVTAGHGREVALALFRVEAGRELLTAGDQARDAHPRPRELLDDDRVLGEAEAQAAVLLGDEDAEEAQLRHLGAELHRDLACDGVEFVRDRKDLLHREVAGQGLDREPVLGEEGGHRGVRRGCSHHRSCVRRGSRRSGAVIAAQALVAGAGGPSARSASDCRRSTFLILPLIVFGISARTVSPSGRKRLDKPI